IRVGIRDFEHFEQPAVRTRVTARVQRHHGLRDHRRDRWICPEAAPGRPRGVRSRTRLESEGFGAADSMTRQLKYESFVRQVSMRKRTCGGTCAVRITVLDLGWLSAPVHPPSYPGGDEEGWEATYVGLFLTGGRRVGPA